MHVVLPGIDNLPILRIILYNFLKLIFAPGKWRKFNEEFLLELKCVFTKFYFESSKNHKYQRRIPWDENFIRFHLNDFLLWDYRFTHFMIIKTSIEPITSRPIYASTRKHENIPQIWWIELYGSYRYII